MSGTPNLLQLRASTTTPLGASATYSTGPMKGVAHCARIVGVVFADQTGNVIVEQSMNNGVNFDVQQTIPIVASTGLAVSVELVAPTWQVRIVNGATPQGTLRAGFSQRAI